LILYVDFYQRRTEFKKLISIKNIQEFLVKMKNKVERLRKLKEMGLPCPNFEVVKNFEEIKWQGENEQYCGWTIRTSLDEGRDFSLPFAPEISKEEIKKKIPEFKEKLGELKERASFIIYPSMKFPRTGNLMITDDRIIIEGVRDSLFPDKKHPDLHLSYLKKGNNLPVLMKSVGDTSLLTYNEILSLLNVARTSNMSNVNFEWVFEEKNKLKFYDVIPFKDNSKN
jgi:hypothetical protein